MGVPAGFDEAATTRPYYRSTYVFISRRDRHLHITSFDDPRLRTLKIGVHVLGEQDDSLPPVHAFISRGIVRNLVGFSIFGNLNEKNPPADLIRAVADGKVDVAVAWGPLAGYFSRQSRDSARYHTRRWRPDAIPIFPFTSISRLGSARATRAEAKLDAELVRRHSDNPQDSEFLRHSAI